MRNFELPELSGQLQPAGHSCFCFQNLSKIHQIFWKPLRFFENLLKCFFYFGGFSYYTLLLDPFGVSPPDQVPAGPRTLPRIFGPPFLQNNFNVVQHSHSRTFHHSDEESCARREIVVSFQRSATPSSQRNKNRVASAILEL